MKGDFSRHTFQPEKHYDAVLMQQGRVLLDADFNVQQAIDQHRLHTQTVDEIGKCGMPKAGGGFEIKPLGTSFKISKGRYYVHGLLCENEQEIDYLDQDKGSLPRPPHPSKQLGVAQTGLVYLEAWQRQVTVLDDPYLSEKALRVPDTTTRLQTIWQVRVLPVPGFSLKASEVREKVRRGEPLGSEWDSLALSLDDSKRVKLVANTRPVDESSEDDSLCVLPPTAGYRGLTNQLYRVEIHCGSEEPGGPSFKWSRENASISAAITGYSGSNVSISENGRVSLVSFPPESWVEITDDIHELNGRPGLLAKVASSTPSIRLKLPSGDTLESRLGEFDASRHPRLILWDEGEVPYNAEEGILITSAHGPYALEAGIQVEFKNEIYRSGDYWLIPARVETGQIEWPPYDNPSAPRGEQPPAGTQHYFCPLAIIRSGIPFAVEDCRLTFPALNFIEASDVRFDNASCSLNNLANEPAATVQEALDALCRRPQGGGHCTIAISGGSSVEDEIAKLDPGKNARICISAGDYVVKQPVHLRNMGSITIVGIGRGTRILAPGVEAAFVFEKCKDVVVQDLTVISGKAGTGTQAGFESLSGTLTFRNCDSVIVENVAVTCADQFFTAASCITVANQAPPIGATRSGGTRIRGCDLTVGFRQLGILLLNVSRAQVEDNTVRVAPLSADFGYQNLLLSSYKKPFLKLLRRRIFANFHTGPTPPANVRINVTLNIDQRPSVHFFSPFMSQAFWDNLLATAGPIIEKVIKDLNLDIVVALKKLAELIIMRDESLFAVLPDQTRGFWTMISFLLERAHGPAASQGIVVAGQAAKDVRILNNTIEDCMQGIHIGFSGPNAGTAGNVLISGDTINVSLPVYADRDRHAIFVGNCDSLTIENNTLACFPGLGRTRSPEIDGVRLYGMMGRKMLVRQNHITQFTNGVYANPLFNVNLSLPASLWVITDNVTPSTMINSVAVKVDPVIEKYELDNKTVVIRRTPNYK